MINVLVIGPSIHGMGGIAAVIRQHLEYGDWTGVNLLHLDTFENGSSLHKLLHFIAAIGRFVGLILSKKLDILHVHTGGFPSSFLRKSVFVLLGKLAGKKVIFHSHNSDTFQRLSIARDVRFYFVKFVLSLCDAVIVLGEFYRPYVSNFVDVAKVTVVFNPCSAADKRVFSEHRKACQLLFLGELGNRKRIWDVLAAVQKVKQTFPQVRLIAGGNGELEKARQMAKDYGIADCVEFPGWVVGQDKQNLLLSSTVYLLPSEAEALPMGIIEAMQCGLPVIATPVGAVPEVITNQVTGVLVAVGDIDGLAGAIIELLSSLTLRDRLAVNAIESVSEKFGMPLLSVQITSIYNKLLSSR
jgi:glycosyltransferase involved in cell wall biosynthesis